MAIPSELCAWLPSPAPWKGSRIYTTLGCLLNKTVLLFCCHGSPNLKSSPAPASSCAQISRTPAFVFSLWPQENAPWAVLFPSKALLHVTPRERPSPGTKTWSSCRVEALLLTLPAVSAFQNCTNSGCQQDSLGLTWRVYISGLISPPPLKKTTFLISEKLGQLSITWNSILLLLTETAQSALRRSRPHS